MSVESLIAQHGYSVSHYRATNTVATNGGVKRTYTLLATRTAFVQPRSSSDSSFAGRNLGQNSVTFYLAGNVSVLSDDYFLTGLRNGNYYVTGVRRPIERPTASANCHTIVDTEYREA